MALVYGRAVTDEVQPRLGAVSLPGPTPLLSLSLAGQGVAW